MLMGLDVGGTKIAGGLVSMHGRLLYDRRVSTPVAAGRDGVVRAITDLGNALQAEAGQRTSTVLAAGVATAGVVDVATGTVTAATTTLPDWAGTRLGPRLEGQWRMPVVVDNDVNAAAVGEAREDQSLATGLVLVVSVGTGVGGALLHAGELGRGPNHTTGELSHLLVDVDPQARPCGCGGQGHLEAYVSGPAIAASYAAARGSAPDSLQQVAQHAAAGDGLAQAAITEGARVLGQTLGGLAILLDLHAIVVCGGVLAVGNGYWPRLCTAVRETVVAAGWAGLPVHQARLGPSAGIIGAALLAGRHHDPNFDPSHVDPDSP